MIWPVLLASCAGGEQTDGEPPAAYAKLATSAAAAAPFVDRTADVGIDFVHRNGMTGRLYLPEIMGPGVALLDYDGDGDLDLFVPQGGPLDGGDDGDRRPAGGGGTQLYRNDLSGDPASLRFTNVTGDSGIEPTGYGMGVAVADVDNDGRVDLYVTRLGANALLLNQGAGAGGTVTFADVAPGAGVADSDWGVSATFFDYDRDGWLDLYVGNYVDFTLARHKPCYRANGAVDYCGPLAFRPQPDRLFRNLGIGTDGRVRFEDVSAAAGITRVYGNALGVVAGDFDGDGLRDLYVANDLMPNQLWINRGDGTFEERALLAGCSVNAEGAAEAGMGIDVGDVDGDGDFDIVVSHIRRQTNTLYLNDGAGFFHDGSLNSGLGTPSWAFTGFGAAFLDYDNDGWLDFFVANGAVNIVDELEAAGDPYPLHQTNQLFRNLGIGTGGGIRFEEITPEAGDALALSEVSRGAAFGDLDNDGDVDIVVANNNGPLRVLINQVGQERPWLGLRLLEAEVPRDALGARVEVRRRQRPPLHRRVRTDGSYASASDSRVLVGLGHGAAVEAVRVVWPSGRLEVFRDLETRRYTTLREGSGQPSPESD